MCRSSSACRYAAPSAHACWHHTSSILPRMRPMLCGTYVLRQCTIPWRPWRAAQRGEGKCAPYMTRAVPKEPEHGHRCVPMHWIQKGS